MTATIFTALLIAVICAILITLGIALLIVAIWLISAYRLKQEMKNQRYKTYEYRNSI